MKIQCIFDDQLFAFKYENEKVNEFDRLMDLWTDVYYLKTFAEKNKVSNVIEFINEILKNAEEIQNFLDNLSQSNNQCRFYFQPLQNSEQHRILALHKGKIRKNRLRYYAIKLDENSFVITGGAIKMSRKMSEHPQTAHELVKLQNARSYLNSNGVLDKDSFFELLKE